jgi:predicted GIY-YIG superfamily endonuclease
LKNPDNNRTYNGFTVNPKRRIRQHNGEITGGAKYTTQNSKNWEIYFLMFGFPDKQNALQCEWKIKHPNNKRKRPQIFSKPKGRINGVCEIFEMCDKWTSKSLYDIKDLELTILIHDDYYNLINDKLLDKENIKIIKCNDILNQYELLI